MPNAPLHHWIVGSAFGRSDDQTARFLAEGIWEIANPSDADQALVKAMQPGDEIAIKSTFVQEHGLPFDLQGQSVCRPLTWAQAKHSTARRSARAGRTCH